MKPITLFESRDGSRFPTAEAAQKHEALLDALDDALAPLGPKYEDGTCDFSNGHGYIEHDSAKVERVKLAVLRVIKRAHPDWFKGADALNNGDIRAMSPGSRLGRLLDDSHSPGYVAWCRLACIDAHGREWGQMFFAINPRHAPIPYRIGSEEWQEAMREWREKVGRRVDGLEPS